MLSWFGVSKSCNITPFLHLKPLDSNFSSGIHIMFHLWAPVVTIDVVLNIVIIEMTFVIHISKNVAGDDLVEVSGAVTKI